MTKLLEWLSVIVSLFAIWYTVIAGIVKHPVLEQYMNVIIVSPVLLVLSFGIYSVTVILYRVFTFNNCEEDAKELQKEILEAKKELRNKGFEW